jgi:WD40 repeat protein
MVGAVALASDGNTLASNAWMSSKKGVPCSELKIWDLARGKLIRDIECNDCISSGGPCGLAFVPGGQLLAAACTGEFRGIKVWDTGSGKEVKKFAYDTGFPLAVAISPDGKCLASGGGDSHRITPDSSSMEGSLYVWDWESGKREQILVKQSTGYVRDLAFSNDGTRLVAGTSGPIVDRGNTSFVSSIVHCWEVKTWTRLWTLQGSYGSACSLDISPDGQYVSCSDSSGTYLIDATLGLSQGYWMSSRYISMEEVVTDRARALNREEWPASILRAANSRGRVYLHWINGTEHLFYRGNARALNEAMRKFAAVSSDNRQLVLLPGIGKTNTLGGQPVAFDWQLEVPLGLDLAVSNKKPAKMTVHIPAGKRRPIDEQQFHKWLQDLDSDSFDKRTAASEALQKLGNDARPLLVAALDAEPTLEKRRRLESLLGELPSFDLTELEIPKGVIVLGVGELVSNGLQELKDPDHNVRKDAVQDLGGLVRFSDKIVPALVETFENDKDNHIRQVSAHCLADIGAGAKPAIPALKKALKDPDVNIRSACGLALKRIASAEETANELEQIKRELAIVKDISELKSTGPND